MSTVVSVLEPYAITIKETARSESCCVAEVYNRLGRGEYLGLKDGRRTFGSLGISQGATRQAAPRPFQGTTAAAKPIPYPP